MTTQAPATNGKATRIERKLQILESQGTKEIEKRIDHLLTEIALTHNSVNGRQRDLSEAKERLAIEDARLVADAEGSNAEKRKASALAAKLEDAAYYTQYQAFTKAQQEYDEAAEAYERIKRDYSVRMAILKLRTAQLEFLGGDL